jgi:hypothetical protein
VKSALDKLIREAREDAGARAPAVDWKGVEEKLFARIDELQKAERNRFAGSRRAWVATLAAAAAALAVLALVFGRPVEHVPLANGSHPVETGETVGSVAEIASSGRVLLRGEALGRGAALAVGDEIDVQGGDALIESPGRLRLIVEKGSRIRVARRRSPLVVALERGAVEADVAPVASGEAFAVDVAHSRIAVHGTHFRVERIGPRAEVDLTEGVVSVGEAPRDGALLGTVVTAPAHVEFAVSNARGTLTINHDPTSVRPAASWGGVASAEVDVSPSASVRTVDRAPDGRSDARPGSSATATKLPDTRPLPPSTAQASSSAAASTPASTSPEDVVTNAVRACMAERPRADNVTVLFQTTLELDVGDDGVVRSARFDPPALPDVTECAASRIYRVHFAHGGPVSIPIDFKN